MQNRLGLAPNAHQARTRQVLDLRSERAGQFGRALRQGGLDRLQGLQLDGLDLVLLLGLAREVDDPVERGRWRASPSGCPVAASVAAPAQGHGGVVPDVAILIFLEPRAEGLDGLVAPEESQCIDGDLAELGISPAAAWPARRQRLGSSSLPSSRAACLARLAAASIRIGRLVLRLEGLASGSIGSTLRPSARVASSVWKAPSVLIR